MKRFLATTATALVLSSGAFAADHASSYLNFQFMNESNIYASELIGMRVYTTETEAGETVAANGEAEWDDIGEINDVVLTRGGEVAAVIVGVGGFLGIGERDVAVDMGHIKFVSEEDDPGDYFLVVNSSRKMLEDAQPFARGADGMTQAHANSDTVNDRPILTRPAIERTGYAQVDQVELTSETLTGARVYGINDEDIGEVSELILTDTGEVNKVVLDVGGFLGIGEKRVAVSFDELQILRSDDGSDFRVYIDATQEALEQQPEHDT